MFPVTLVCADIPPAIKTGQPEIQNVYSQKPAQRNAKIQSSRRMDSRVNHKLTSDINHKSRTCRGGKDYRTQVIKEHLLCQRPSDLFSSQSKQIQNPIPKFVFINIARLLNGENRK